MKVEHLAELEAIRIPEAVTEGDLDVVQDWLKEHGAAMVQFKPDQPSWGLIFSSPGNAQSIGKATDWIVDHGFTIRVVSEEDFQKEYRQVGVE